MTLIQSNVPASRVIVVLPRSDGEFGVQGAVRLLAGETLSFALEFKGTHLPPGMNLLSMSAPTVGGTDAANLTITDYIADDTQAKFVAALDALAETTDDITLECTVQLSSTETIIVPVPVEIGG